MGGVKCIINPPLSMCYEIRRVGNLLTRCACNVCLVLQRCLDIAARTVHAQLLVSLSFHCIYNMIVIILDTHISVLHVVYTITV